ncbi:MATE family efflux transporter [Desulfothermus okinawensis JCM 13304]
MFFHFWIGFLDVYVAGLIDKNVQAALGIVTQILFFLLIVAISFANGSVSTISQSIGARKILRAKRYAALSLTISFVAGIILCILGLLFRDELAGVLGTPKEIFHICKYFLKIYTLLIPVYYLFIVSNAIFRARKKVYVPLISIMTVTILNGILNFTLCFGYFGIPKMGFKGLPWATFISVSSGFLLNYIILFTDRWISKKYIPNYRWIKSFFPYLWKVSWPIGLNQLLWHFAYVILFSITATLPNKNLVALAAFTAGVRIESILFLPAFAFNMTASILVGHFLGEGDFIQAKDVAKKIWIIGITSITFMSLILWIFIYPVSAILSHDISVQLEIVNYLKYNIIAIPFTVTTMIFGGSFVGAGATKLNMICVGGSVWLIRVPLAYLLGHVLLKEPTGIWVSMLCSQVIQSIFMTIIFFRNIWGNYAMKKEVSYGKI